MKDLSDQRGLYVPEMEKDSCGTGLIAQLNGTKSHQLIEDALLMLSNMEHRGACGCEPNTGDGAGILIQLPDLFFRNWWNERGISLPDFGNYAVGFLFLPKDPVAQEASKGVFESCISEMNMEVIGYRPVPTNPNGLGKSALAVEPYMEQIFLRSKENLEPKVFERKLLVLRKYGTHRVHQAEPELKDFFYLCSLSYKTIVYKGQLTTHQLSTYYPDLHNPDVISAIALIHSRFSTNTFPKWKLAQPFRYIAHNGEINTITGNLNWWKARESLLESSFFSSEDLEKMLPICYEGLSDSGSFDNVLEFMFLNGRSFPHALMTMIPEAWQHDDLMEDYKKAFYEYHETMMEPWDGPASICFSDGIVVGATLDRNGLRPSRYNLLDDNTLIVASETGALPVDQSRVVFKGRLQPGKMLIADLDEHRIIGDGDLKARVCKNKPYQEWLKEHKLYLRDLPETDSGSATPDYECSLIERQKLFGFTREDLKYFLQPMAKSGDEPIGSMGIDTPLAILSHKPQHLANYFKQLFAQVTNPPIDPIRERNVMSLFTHLGPSGQILKLVPENCKQIHLDQPVLSRSDLARLEQTSSRGFKIHRLEAVFNASNTPGLLEAAIESICAEAEIAVQNGANILLVSDELSDHNHIPIPSLLITGALHHHLIRNGLRTKTSIITCSGDTREAHHFATLIGFGADAVLPYLAFESIEELYFSNELDQSKLLDYYQEKYIKSIGKGLLKIISKIGISTLKSYKGAQIFEIIGINREVVDKCFKGTISRIEGLGFDGIAREAYEKWVEALRPEIEPQLPVGGLFQWKKDGEFHLFNPQTIHLLQKATRTNDYTTFRKYADLINDQATQACTLRGLLEFQGLEPIPVSEVEPVENILKRFSTGAMSFGSISHEAHTTLAIAMNRIGAKSNSGEGGEDEIRFEPKPNGDWERSAVKQVASGRFGVTSYYLTNAAELQIKMAQGAKPGEGGQLPGHKVDEWIARVRHSTPGVGLISPPPHHDIYSIEDLAQLIFDLKNSNRDARINVKLVSKAGVGVIASGVTKAHADVILISGHDGGTGASPITSIRHAGLPWELGVAEAQQTLVRNKLRDRVVLQTDGQMRTGRDLAIAALLGAEEWGVATAALVVEGCIMMRKCHLNTCPVGIATQDETLRGRFTGDPDHVVNFFTFLAQDLREIMASLGYRTVNEMIGHVEKLRFRREVGHWKYNLVDLSPLLMPAKADEPVHTFHCVGQDHGMENILDWQLLKRAQLTLETGANISSVIEIKNTDRAVGTLLSNEISKMYKKEGLPQDSIVFRFRGSAGQSFGAFAAKGLKFILEGEANDYFGKGLSGARLVVTHDRDAHFDPGKNIIIGNVAFYGATSGEAYIKGMAGERFCVRNSGVKAVVEGVGDHCCEYMTGGRVAVLGSTGKNFAAGMSGGIAYVYDPAGTFHLLCNQETVDLEPLSLEDQIELRQLVREHCWQTSSAKAFDILGDWNEEVQHFVKVMPREYKRVLEQQLRKSTAGIPTIVKSA